VSFDRPLIRDRARLTDDDPRRAAAIQLCQKALDAWLGLFCANLQNTTRLPLYQHLADLLNTAWEAIVAADDLPRASATEASIPTLSDEPPDIGCPAGLPQASPV